MKCLGAVSVRENETIISPSGGYPKGPTMVKMIYRSLKLSINYIHETEHCVRVKQRCFCDLNLQQKLGISLVGLHSHQHTVHVLKCSMKWM